MANFQQLYQAVEQAGPVMNRAIVAVAVAAQGVLTELDATPNHAARLAWARKTLGDPKAMTRTMAYALAADGVVSAKDNTATDAEILAAVVALIDTFALA